MNAKEDSPLPVLCCKEAGWLVQPELLFLVSFLGPHHIIHVHEMSQSSNRMSDCLSFYCSSHTPLSQTATIITTIVVFIIIDNECYSQVTGSKDPV